MPDNALDHLIKKLAALPGLGNRSARRIALHLLQNRRNELKDLEKALKRAEEDIRDCVICGNLDTVSPCRICQNQERDTSTICVLARVSDLWALERTGAYKGLYHVLGGVLSALDGIGPEDLNIESFLGRVREGPCTEVILGLSATVDGQSTAHYLADRLAGSQIRISRLAHGMPVGGELDYLDSGTITTALNARRASDTR